MRRTLFAFALLGVFCVSAIGIAHAEPDRRPVEMSAADTAKWLAFFDQLVDTMVRTAAAPCDKMAAEVNAVIDANRDAVAVARAAHTAGRKLPKAAQQHMRAGVQTLLPGMRRCGSEGTVRAAFARLDLTRRDSAAARRR